MSYTEIDPIINSWAKNNNLEIFTMDRDWEIRSFRIDESIKRGRNYKIWVDMPDNSKNILVHVMNMDSPNNKNEIRTDKFGLENTLDEALSIAIGN